MGNRLACSEKTGQCPVGTSGRTVGWKSLAFPPKMMAEPLKGSSLRRAISRRGKATRESGQCVMKVGELEKYGIPTRVIEAWRMCQGEHLLPVQQTAVRKKLLGNPSEWQKRKEHNMIISAPTSSGKSFCAEMAAIQSLASRQKVVMLFPLKSLIEEKYKVCQATYSPLGIKSLILTGDYPENDSLFHAGDYDIALCVYEKFDSFLTSSLDILKNIGLVVVDEIQTIAEPGRGALLEQLLTKIKSSVYKPSLLGLSAVIGDDSSSAGKLASWLDATVVEERIRPVELIRGVATEGTYRFRSFNGHIDGEEPFASADPSMDSFELFVGQVKASSGSTLIFLKSRSETMHAALKLAYMVDWKKATNAIDKLSAEEPSFLLRSLKQALQHGVAFHNADLTQKQRNIVEQAFINKEIRAIFSTTTLAMGVNLPADTVYLETVKYASGTYGGKPSLVPVSRAEFDNMTGRAGRYHAENSPAVGKAIVMAQSEFDRDILWSSYISCDQPEEFGSAFYSRPIEDWLLNMVATGLIQTKSQSDAELLFSQTFSGLLGVDKSNDFSALFDQLVMLGMIVENKATSLLSVTPFGLATAKHSLSVSEATYYRYVINEQKTTTDFGWLALVLSGAGWLMPSSLLSRYEQLSEAPLRMLYQEYELYLDDTKVLLGDDFQQKQLSYRQMASLKALMLLEQWRQLVPVQVLEERFQIHLGQIVSLGETAGHLMIALSELIQAEERDIQLKKNLADLSFSLRFGLPSEYREIYGSFGDMLTRSDFTILQNASIVSLDDFCRMEESIQLLFLGGKDKLMKINEKIELIKEEVQMESRTNNVVANDAGLVSMMFGEPEMIEIDGSYECERYLVKINGLPVRLTGKSFKYFVKLAWSRLYGESGWIYKEEIENGFNQARYLYRMKNEVGRDLNSNWSIFENNRLGYYRLNVDPSKISINLDNIKNHPDYEVRTLFESRQMNNLN